MNVKQLIFVLALSFLGHFAGAQTKNKTIKGVVIDKNTNSPVEFATVIIADNTSKKPITGVTTDETGVFNFTTKAANFYVEVSFIGYTSRTITDFNNSNTEINLGQVFLSEEANQLEEVVVRAEKSSTEFKLDKRVFNVGKDLSSTGASAIEVLNNVPSVNVNIEGQISLRGGQGAQILINGKPSVIASQEGNALGTITADQIEKIEVITNPSAKYEAEGTTGIINIVLRKNEKAGVNGSITLNTGIPNNHSIGFSLNKRTEKFNIFSQLGVGKRTFPNTYNSLSRNKANGTEISTIGSGNKNEQFYNVVLGTDYHINKNNVITLSGNFAYEFENEDSESLFTEDYTDNTLNRSYNRIETTEATNPKFQYELQYKKDFENNKEQNLLFSALGSFFGKDQSSEFDNAIISGVLNSSRQQTRTNFKEAQYTFKLDYTHPLSEQYTIETGGQYVLNDVTNDYAVNDFINNVWVNNAGLTNIFNFNQNVLGTYVTGAYEGEKWGLKLGTRLENTNLETVLQNTNENNSQNYTNLFPSIHTSYKITPKFSLQAGFSKRIYRPRLWDLNPFFNIRNNFNIFTGNPNLQPEFTDSYEITSIHKLGRLNLNLGVYHRYTTDVIEDVSFFNETTNVTTRRPENFGTSNTTGFEANYKVSLAKWFSLNGDFNYNIFNRKGQFDTNNNFDFNGTRWNTKSTAKFKLPASFDLEVTTIYRSQYKTAQNLIKDNLFANLGLRKKIIKGKVILNLSVRDIFASRRFQSITDVPTFYAESDRQRGRFVTFGISYGFGKGEAMEFGASKRF